MNDHIDFSSAIKPWQSPDAQYPVDQRSSPVKIRGAGGYHKPSPEKVRAMRIMAETLRSRYSATAGELGKLTGIKKANAVETIISSLCYVLPIWEERDDTCNQVWYGVDRDIMPEVTPFEKGETDEYV